MGKRVNYEIVGDDESVGVILYANNSDKNVNPDDLFTAALREDLSVSDMVRNLLGMRYPLEEGSSSPGRPIFTIDLSPGDREYVLRANVGLLFEGRLIGEPKFKRISSQS